MRQQGALHVDAITQDRGLHCIDSGFTVFYNTRTEGDKLYSLELEEINQLGGTLDRLKHLLKEEPSTIPLRAADDVVARFLSKVKEYFGENALPPVSATFSIRAATPYTLDRFTADPLGERIIHTIRTGRARKASIPILAASTHASCKSSLCEFLRA